MANLFDLPFDDGDASEAHDARGGPRVYTVTEITADVRLLLETTWSDVWVEGEISNCRLWNTGHIYFSLKDPGAQLRAVMFKGAARSLKFKLEDGLAVVARGRLNVYEPKGEYQIVCDDIEPKGLGARQLALDQLKKRLQAEGLLDPARKRPLPALPRRIGIVTSIDGAALRDMLKVLGRRYPNAHLVIAPTRVQGDTAAADIARALGQIGRVEGVDVVIVGRGGGSIEDLWAFNEEAVARAIARCPVPVISAVGHEVDVTLADLVADLRAPTPSAAAEIVVAAKNEFVARIDRLEDRLTGAARGRMLDRRHALQRLIGRPAFAGFPAHLALRGRHVAELLADLQRAGRDAMARRQRRFQALRLRLDALNLQVSIGRIQTRLAQADARLRAAVVRRAHRASAQLGSLAARIDSLSPLAVLGRGYALCWDAARGTILTDARAVSEGDAVRVTLHRGELSCVVTGREAPDAPEPGTSH
ncbi:MAG: exodeoxyribonuclease VII large subunit [Acidobacteria bacterium]|nr:exodeoxyribonuclease VII large subunit [Acidobacteriota bacterium]